VFGHLAEATILRDVLGNQFRSSDPIPQFTVKSQIHAYNGCKIELAFFPVSETDTLSPDRIEVLLENVSAIVVGVSVYEPDSLTTVSKSAWFKDLVKCIKSNKRVFRVLLAQTAFPHARPPMLRSFSTEKGKRLAKTNRMEYFEANAYTGIGFGKLMRAMVQACWDQLDEDVKLAAGATTLAPSSGNTDRSRSGSAPPKLAGVVCSHANSLISSRKLKKLLKKNPQAKCEDCTSVSDQESTEVQESYVKGDHSLSATFWVCLVCGHIGCGRESKQHAVTHWEENKDDSHAIVLNCHNRKSWCYACDCEITATSKRKRVRDIQDLKVTLRKHQSDLALARRKQEAKEARAARKDAPRGIRGLVNMGNTCFFNSVLQSLAQCHPLRDYFRHHPSDRGEHLLTASLRSFMESMWKENAKGSFRPSTLHSAVVRSSKRFRGYRQEDSHELLRYLVDGIRTEEQRRTKTTRKRPGAWSGTFIEEIFGGVLTSTVLCDECHQESVTTEVFLDISLPWPTMRGSKSSKATAAKRAGFSSQTTGFAEEDEDEDVNDDRPSCSSASSRPVTARLHTEPPSAPPTSDSPSFAPIRFQEYVPPASTTIKTPAAQSEATSETSAQTDPSKAKTGEATSSTATNHCSSSSSGKLPKDKGKEEATASGENDAAHDSELEYYSDDDSEPERSGSDSEDDDPVVVAPGALRRSSSFSASTDASRASAEGKARPSQWWNDPLVADEAGEDAAVPAGDPVAQQTAIHKIESLPVSSSSQSHVSSSHASGSSSSSPGPTQWNVPKKSAIFAATPSISGSTSVGVPVTSLSTARKIGGSAGKSQGAPFSTATKPSSSSTTTSSSTRGFYSIERCLDEFTAPDLLFGENAYGCLHCTKAAGRPVPNDDEDSSNFDMIKTRATKQFRFRRAPRILTLHVKRFQSFGSISRKISSPMRFSPELDFTPFLEDAVRENGEKAIYQLFAVVTHQGGMGGGHYTCHVKHANHADLSKRSWYYFSDTSWRRATETQVFRSEAYLLFYERVDQESIPLP